MITFKNKKQLDWEELFEELAWRCKNVEVFSNVIKNHTIHLEKNGLKAEVNMDCFRELSLKLEDESNPIVYRIEFKDGKAAFEKMYGAWDKETSKYIEKALKASTYALSDGFGELLSKEWYYTRENRENLNTASYWTGIPEKFLVDIDAPWGKNDEEFLKDAVRKINDFFGENTAEISSNRNILEHRDIFTVRFNDNAAKEAISSALNGEMSRIYAIRDEKEGEKQ